MLTQTQTNAPHNEERKNLENKNKIKLVQASVPRAEIQSPW